MRSRWRQLLLRLLPPYGQRREVHVAEEVRAILWQQLLVHTTLFEFEFKLIPLGPEVDPAIGFVSAAADVVAQSRGGTPGGFGSINGVLGIYQVFFLESEVEKLMQRTFDLHASPSTAFIAGSALGQAFGNAIAAGSIEEALQASTLFFPKMYRHYCSNPEGKPRGRAQREDA